MPEQWLAEAKAYLAEHKEIVWKDDARTAVHWDCYCRAMMLSVHLEQQREGTMDYEVHVWRVGDAALVGLPGEPFVETQLRIKLASPTYWTLVMHMTSHYVGYVPTREAFERRGGHETELSTWSNLAPEAPDMIVEAATGALWRLFPEVQQAEG